MVVAAEVVVVCVVTDGEAAGAVDESGDAAGPVVVGTPVDASTASSCARRASFSCSNSSTRSARSSAESSPHAASARRSAAIPALIVMGRDRSAVDPAACSTTPGR